MSQEKSGAEQAKGQGEEEGCNETEQQRIQRMILGNDQAQQEDALLSLHSSDYQGSSRAPQLLAMMMQQHRTKDEQDVMDLQTKLKSMKKDLDSVHSDLERAEDRIIKLTRELEEKDRSTEVRMRRLTRELEDKEHATELLRKKVSMLTQDLQQKDKEIYDLSRSLRHYNGVVEDFEGQIKRLREDLVGKDAQLADLTATIKEKEKTIVELQEKIKEQDTKIKEQDTKLDTLARQMTTVLQTQSLVIVRETVCNMFHTTVQEAQKEWTGAQTSPEITEQFDTWSDWYQFRKREWGANKDAVQRFTTLIGDTFCKMFGLTKTDYELLKSFRANANGVVHSDYSEQEVRDSLNHLAHRYDAIVPLVEKVLPKLCLP